MKSLSLSSLLETGQFVGGGGGELIVEQIRLLDNQTHGS